MRRKDAERKIEEHIEKESLRKQERIIEKESNPSLPKSNTSADEVDQFTSSQLTWSSRYKCFQAYLCFVLSYLSVLKLCERLGKYRALLLLPYFVCNVFAGVPAVLVEIMLGRFVMGNVAEAWNMCPPMRGVFWIIFIITSYAITFNSIYSIFLLKYFFSSFHGHLKWEKCNSPWSKINCYTIGQKSQAMIKCRSNHTVQYCSNLKWETSGSQFWKYSVENKDSALEISLSFVCLAISILFVSLIIYKGIRSLEKMIGFLIYLSAALWAVLVTVTFTSPRALNGLVKLFRFNWSDFLLPEVWVEGLEDTFYLLGLSRLSLSFVSSHGNFTDNILYDVVIVVFGSVVSNLLVTVPILCIIASTKSLGDTKIGKPLFEDDVDIFISMSDALVLYPYPKTLWSAVFYLHCFLITLSSEAVLVLALCEAIQGILKKKEKAYSYIVIVVCTFAFILAALFIYIQVGYELNHSILIVTTVTLCTISWQLFYGVRKFNYDYFFLLGYRIPTFIQYTWITLVLVPIVGLAVKMYFGQTSKPLLIFIYPGLALFIYILVILISIMRFHIKKIPIIRVLSANPNWGPENPVMKKSRSVFDRSTVTREFMYRQELYKKPFIKPYDFSSQNIVQLI